MRTMSMKPLTIFFSVGEPSGDLHGANLIAMLKQQRPGLRAVGFGGPRMAAAGMDMLSDLTELAVMWFAQAVANLSKFWGLLKQADDYFRTQRPDAVVLIDYPGFNWWVARKAKSQGIPVIYYGAPQMWAWGGWRIGKMRRLVDHLLCKLPFEAEWYRERGCAAVYVGHPYFDQLTKQPVDREFLMQHAVDAGQHVVGLLPGSRMQEVRTNLPAFLKAAELIAARVPGTRFAVASFNEKQAELARAALAGNKLPASVFVDHTSEVIQLSSCCMACSGSVSLELMYYAKPSVIHYWVNRQMYFLAKHCLLQCKYMTLVNLLACEDRFDLTHAPYDPRHPGAELVPFPEYPTCRDKSVQLAEHVIQWLQTPAEYRRRVEQLVNLRSRFCKPGATRQAAEYILRQLALNSPASHRNRAA
jgi:lipid-A-disaccharide synthase